MSGGTEIAATSFLGFCLEWLLSGRCIYDISVRIQFGVNSKYSKSVLSLEFEKSLQMIFEYSFYQFDLDFRMLATPSRSQNHQTYKETVTFFQ